MNRSALIKFIFVPLTSLALWACGGGEARRLPDSGFAVEFLENTIPNRMSAGKDSAGDVVIRNISKTTWPSRANAKNRSNVVLSYRWKDLKGQVIVADGMRTALPQDLAPGESVRLKMNVAAPARPGRYVINVTLVQEGFAWFDEKGGAALSLPVVVAPSASTAKEAGQDSSAASGAGAMKSAKADLPKPVDELPDGDKKLATKPAKSTISRGAQGQPAGSTTIGQTTGNSWFVQVGSYPDSKTAERIAKKLSGKGYHAFVVAADIRGKKHHRVRVGPLASRAEAEKLQRVLRDKENLPRTIVAR